MSRFAIDRREHRRRPSGIGRGALRVERLEARRLLATLTVLDETFAAITTGSSTSTTGSSTAWSGSADWPSVEKAFQAGGAVRLGTSTATGSITSRTIDLSGGPVTVSFGVKGWTTVEGSLVVTVSGQPAQTVSYVATMSSSFETKSLTFSAGQAAATISFATTAKRAFLDDILVTVESGPPLVHAIRGLAWDDADGDGLRAGEPGLAGRTIYLDLDDDGALGVGEPTATTATDGSYAFDDLAAGTYTVAQVVPEGWEQTAPPVAEAGAGARLSRSLAAIAPVRQAADFVGPLPVRRHVTRLIPNDPLFSQQWHLRNTGQSGGTAGEDIRAATAWDRALGSGVVIGIVDDGLQSTHPDLSGRYVSSLSYDFNGNDTNPAPGTGDDHGTAVAGIAAATGNNGIGVSGVAPAASLAGLRLVAAATTDAEEAEALNHRMQDIHIYNNSWGPDDTGDNLEAPGPFTLAALKNGVENGRGGLGSIYVWSAGNGLEANDNVNYDGYANSRYTIAVTAVDDAGRQAFYAEPGAPILVAAPGGGLAADITTTDRTGSAGYSAGDYATDFGGTSAAAPVVSGVVALMLEANPDLSWRDVQHVLVESARKNHATDAGWSLNGAGKWVNHKYGFGMVDATAAVTVAETWTPVGAEVSAASGTITVGRRFDQPIARPAAAAIRLVLATGAGSQQILPTAAPVLLAGGTVARWLLPSSFPVLGRGRYVLAMAAGGITNSAGTTTLDGEWTTSASRFAAGSGDGTAGGDFEFAFHVLPGDATGEGVINTSDLSGIRNRLLGPLSTPLGSDADYRFDVNGSNSLTSADLAQARAQMTSALGTRP